MTATSEHHWFKSSYSGGSGTECVECAHADDDTLIRDSKQPEGPVMRIRNRTWHMFVRALARDGLR
ncbi:DUF397 domain-containing protein [Streptomyces lancefieldiae]|uniref:DUF397 domain-containing protein n=1 Tax=Streptomyces lancefieldiae TaxID=3075520 RepID=A0ABU3AT75_9ACTN|nr:DUF397 domain-containing protein [Streptomyces sp. DSM 40712]MDT0613386.1 DUF397 domain-containing protein [Streptomyces sp. DSM 40712]